MMTYLVPRNIELELEATVNQVHTRGNGHVTDVGYVSFSELGLGAVLLPSKRPSTFRFCI